MDRAFHSADNTRWDILGVQDILRQLSTISPDSYQEWIDTFVLTTAASICYMTGRRCRLSSLETHEGNRTGTSPCRIQERLALFAKASAGMKKLNASRLAPRQHNQPNERNLVAWDNGRFDYRKGQAPMPNVDLKEVCCTHRPCDWSTRTQRKQNVRL